MKERKRMSNLSKSLTSAFLVAALCGFAGVANAQLAINPTSHDFGDVEVGMSATQTFAVTNGEGAAVAVSGAGVTADVTAVGADGNIVVTFTPAAAGAVTGSVTVSTGEGATAATASAAVTGNGVDPEPEVDLCMDLMDMIGETGSLAAFIEASGSGADIAGDGLPAEFVLALIEVAGCSADGDAALRAATRMAYATNLAAIDALGTKQVGVATYNRLVAALSASGAAMQVALQALTTEDLPIGSETEDGELEIVMGMDDMGNMFERFSGTGDFDGDGSSNAGEFRLSDGTVAGFLSRANDPTITGEGGCSATLPLAPPSIGNFTGAAGDMFGLLMAVVLLTIISAARRRKAATQA